MRHPAGRPKLDTLPASGDAARPPVRCLLRALVVDESEAMRWHISAALHLFGFECEEAGGGVEALQFTSAGGIDLIVTDLALPNLDGFELVSLVRRGVFGAPPPVIVCTDLLNDARWRDHPELAQCAATIMKAFSPDDLAAAINLAFPDTDLVD